MCFNALICSALTIEEVREEIYAQELPHPEIVLQQARLESGDFRSKLTKTHNNILGLKSRSRYKKYDSYKDCIADYKNRISSRYKGGCYYSFLKRIRYASHPSYIRLLKRIR